MIRVTCEFGEFLIVDGELIEAADDRIRVLFAVSIIDAIPVSAGPVDYAIAARMMGGRDWTILEFEDPDSHDSDGRPFIHSGQ